MSESKDKMSADIARDLADTSGNNFHIKVVRFFRDSGWTVLISPYYVDPSTDKAREIDLIAEKLFYTRDMFGHANGFLRMRLHVECKYVNQTTVFWFDAIDQKKALRRAARHVFQEGNSYTYEHHYLRSITEVAKLFATERVKETESEPMFKAVNQTLNALVSGSHNSLVSSGLPNRGTLDYPVIVCSGFDKFFRKSCSGDDRIFPIVRNFLLEVNYAYASQGQAASDYFLIDVVEFNRLSELFAVLDHEIATMSELLRD